MLCLGTGRSRCSIWSRYDHRSCTHKTGLCARQGKLDLGKEEKRTVLPYNLVERKKFHLWLVICCFPLSLISLLTVFISITVLIEQLPTSPLLGSLENEPFSSSLLKSVKIVHCCIGSFSLIRYSAFADNVKEYSGWADASNQKGRVNSRAASVTEINQVPQN